MSTPWDSLFLKRFTTRVWCAVHDRDPFSMRCWDRAFTGAKTDGDQASTQRRRFAAVRSFSALLVAALLSGCSYLNAENCSVGRQTAEPDGGTKCAVAKNTREVLISGSDLPRLWTGEDARTQSNIDPTTVNALRRSGNGKGVVGYLGTLRIDYPYEPKAIAADLREIRKASGKEVEPGEGASFNFDRVTVDFFLKQTLGGALGLNYVAPDDLGGSITFKTEQPIPKAQILQVARDIVGRYGLQIKLVNGVYHIDRPEALARAGASGAGGDASAGSALANEDSSTRVINVRHGNAAEIAAVVSKLVSEDVSVVPTKSGDALAVRAPPGEFARINALVESLTENGRGNDRVAIIPLRHVPPERLAVRLAEFYRARIGGAGKDVANDVPTIVPLENQRAVLVGVRDPRVMAGLRKLVSELDRNGEFDEITLRIVPLTHTSAEEVTTQLNAVFSSRSIGGPAAPGVAGAAALGAAAGARAATFGQAGGQNGASGGFIPNIQTSSSGAFDAQDDGTGGAQFNGAARPGFARSGAQQAASIIAAEAGGLDGFAGQGGAPQATIKLVADTRNNSVLVYSNYANFQRVKDVLKALDVPQAEVVIEATIAEVLLNDDLQFGVQFFLQGLGFGSVRSSVDRTARDNGDPGLLTNLSATLGPVTAQAVIHALQTVTNVKVISSPYVTVLDNKTARLVVGDQIPFAQKTQSSTSNLGGGTTVTQEIQTKDTGIVLEVTPHIKADNSLVLSVDQTVSTPSASALAGNLTPVISTRQVRSDILGQSGRTILLGGLIQERLDTNDTGIPVVRKVPGLGDLFKTQDNNAKRAELMVLITPRVVRRSTELEQITRLIRDQFHTH
jgi:general secretion pathway protein D